MVVIGIQSNATAGLQVSLWVSCVGSFAEAHEAEIKSKLLNELNQIPGLSVTEDPESRLSLFVAVFDHGCIKNGQVYISFIANANDDLKKGSVVPISYGNDIYEATDSTWKSIVALFNVRYVQPARTGESK